MSGLRWVGARPRVLAFLLALGLYLALLLLVIQPKLPTAGDEPHYLLITHSLCFDHDVDLADNYAHEDYLRFFPVRGIDPHAYDYKGDGRLVSVHGVGLPLLLLPAYCLFGSSPLLPARLTIVLIAALVSCQTYSLAFDLWGDHRRAWLAWAIASLTVPLFWFSSQLYPDVPAALLVVLAARALLKPPAATRVLAAGTIAAALPWLHVRYVPLSAWIVVLAGVSIVRAGRRSEWARALGPPLASGALFLSFYMKWYGSPLSDAQWRFFASTPFDPAAFITRTLGLIGDRQWGVLLIAPVFLLAAAGLVTAVARWDRRMLPFLGFIAPYMIGVGVAETVLPVDTGWAFPGRFLLPVIPLLAVFGCYWAAASRWAWRLAALLLLLSIAVNLPVLRAPERLYAYGGVVRVPVVRDFQGLFPTPWPPRPGRRPVARGRRNTGRLIVDAATGESVAYANPATDAPEHLAWALLTGLKPGVYRAVFEMKAGPAKDDQPVARVVVSTDAWWKVAASREVRAGDLGRSGEYGTVTLDFRAARYCIAEARVYFTGAGELWVRAVDFETVKEEREIPALALWSAQIVAIAGLGVAAARARDGLPAPD